MSGFIFERYREGSFERLLFVLDFEHPKLIGVTVGKG